MPLDRSDDGFTVLELMIAMMVMLIITVPLVTSFVLGLTTTREGEQDVSNSADAQLLSAYFDGDVASADTVGVTSTCGAAGTPVLELRWQDPSLRRVAYRLVDDTAATALLKANDPAFTGTVRQLRRYACGAASPSETVIARTVVAAPQVECNGVVGACSTVPRPRTVSLGFESYSSSLVDTTNVGSNTKRVAFAVTAARRVTQ